MAPGPTSAREGTVRVSAVDSGHPDDSVLAAMARHRLSGRARARLLKHLDECDRCREVLFTLEDAEVETIDPTVARDPIVGMQLGEYVVLERLAQGGMGVVYRGEQPAIGKQVAIKVILPEAAADPELVARLQAEARAVNAIRHPHIVDIFSFGTLPDGRPYLVMELLTGHSLDELIHARGKLSVEETVTVLSQAMPPLAAAHGVGVIHRDLKPANIFLSVLPDGQWHITLLDFGLAKLLNRDALTNPNFVVGTPGYMSPEQIRGQQVSDRTDVYAMGICAFELLAGKEPFVAPSLVELMRKHLDEPAPEMPRDLDVPRPLRELVSKMMAKRPGDRPSASAVSAELMSVRKALGDPLSQRFPNPMVAIETVQAKSISVRTKPLRPGVLRPPRRPPPEAEPTTIHLGDGPVPETRKDQPAASTADLPRPTDEQPETDRGLPAVRRASAPATVAMPHIQANTSDTYRGTAIDVEAAQPWRSRRWLRAALGLCFAAVIGAGVLFGGRALEPAVKSQPLGDPAVVTPVDGFPPPPPPPPPPPTTPTTPPVTDGHQQPALPSVSGLPVARQTRPKTRAEVETAIDSARLKAAKKTAPAMKRIIGLQLDELQKKLDNGTSPAQVLIDLEKVSQEYELK
ncbi:MAG: protein kinase [Myxococcaceae bacterium]